MRHLFRVASSLDSMVLGEPQILGQVKERLRLRLRVQDARHRSSTSSSRRRSRSPSGSAPRPRSRARAVSVRYAAVELAKKIFGDLTDKTVLLIGAGEMCELAAKHLVNNGVRGVLVANRTFERADQLAEEFDGKAIRFDDLFDQLAKADIILSSTGATHFITEEKDVEAVHPAPQERARCSSSTSPCRATSTPR